MLSFFHAFVGEVDMIFTDKNLWRASSTTSLRFQENTLTLILNLAYKVSNS